LEWKQARFSKSLSVSSYVCRHSRLLAAYKVSKEDYNQSARVGSAAEKLTAVEYPTPCATRFLYNRELLLASARNRNALGNLVERNDGTQVSRHFNPENQASLSERSTPVGRGQIIMFPPGVTDAAPKDRPDTAPGRDNL